MTIKVLEDGTTYRKAHAHDWENPELRIKGKCQLYIKVDGIRAIRNKAGRVWSRNSKPLPHLDHLHFQDAEIFRNSWNETSSILGSDDKPLVALSQDNVYELTDGRIDSRLYLGWANDPSNENLEQLMLKMREAGHEGVIVRCQDKKGNILWWKIVPYKYADVRITGFKEGTGKYKGQLGSIKSEHGSAGSGFDDAQRKDIWARRHELLGTIMQVKYRETTDSGKLRFPSFMRLRSDKNEESFD